MNTNLPSRHLDHSGGYTLLEMVIVISIIGIILPALFASITSIYTNHTGILSHALALTKTQRGLNEMVRDVRAAAYAEDGSLPIVSISTSSLTFYTDTDLDGRIEQVRYYIASTSLFRSIIEPTSTSSYPTSTTATKTLTTDVQNGILGVALFQYYSATGTPITNFSNTLDVRRVVIEVLAKTAYMRNASTVRLRSSASIRNLKNVY